VGESAREVAARIKRARERQPVCGTRPHRVMRGYQRC
jgi:hypothetical protein